MKQIVMLALVAFALICLPAVAGPKSDTFNRISNGSGKTTNALPTRAPDIGTRPNAGGGMTEVGGFGNSAGNAPPPPPKILGNSGGRNDYTRGQEVSRGSYVVGDSRSEITVRASKGDIGSVHATTGGPYGKTTHTTAHPDGSFHHHGEHMKGRSNRFTNK